MTDQEREMWDKGVKAGRELTLKQFKDEIKIGKAIMEVMYDKFKLED